MLFKCCASAKINNELTYDIWVGNYKDQAEARNAAFKRAVEVQGYVWDDIGRQIPALLDWKAEPVED